LTMTWPLSSTPLDLFSRTVSTFDTRIERLVELECDDCCQRMCPNPNPDIVIDLRLHSPASSHLRYTIDGIECTRWVWISRRRYCCYERIFVFSLRDTLSWTQQIRDKHSQKNLISFRIVSQSSVPIYLTFHRRVFIHTKTEPLLRPLTPCIIRAHLPSYRSSFFAKSLNKTFHYFSFLLFFCVLWLMFRPRPSVSR
jgi:hypothetical protein